MMFNAKMFLLEDGRESPIILEETGYVAEEVLQEFLANYPDLLPGDQINPEDPRRWLLVSRELSVPNSTSESGRLKLDHLFLDQDGIPTFVECKRSSDTRTRREVVAQMLEYAANGMEYWSIEKLRQAAFETALNNGKHLDDLICKLREDEDTNVEEFWNTVADNLRNYRLRLIFVSDSTPKELRRMVEFLNEEMKHIEVLAVEVKQFKKKDDTRQRILVPRVVGLTESARSHKNMVIAPRRHTNLEEFLEKCTSTVERDFFKRVIDLASERNHIIYWGIVGFSIRVDLRERPATFIFGFPKNKFQFYFDYWLRGTPEEQNLRNSLLKTNLFQESGKYTLTANVTEDNVLRINEVYDFILDEIDRLQKSKTIING